MAYNLGKSFYVLNARLIRGMGRFGLCLIKCHTIKAYWEWKENLTYPLPWDKVDVSSEIYVSATLPQGKIPHCPFPRRLDGPLSQS